MSIDVQNSAVRAFGRAGPYAPAPETALGIRGLIAYTAIFWGCFSAVTTAYAWHLFGQSFDTFWRGIVTDVAGAGLCIVLALLLTEVRRWGPAARLVLALALCLVAVALYAAVALILIGPIVPAAPDGTTGPARLVRAVLMNYWVFAAYAGFFLLLDQGQTPSSDNASRGGGLDMLRADMLGRAEAWEGLDARWFWTFQGIFWTAMVIFSTANLVNGGDDVTNAWRVLLAECTGLMTSSLAHFWVLKPTRMWPLYRRAALALGVAILLTIIYISSIWAAYFQIFPVDPPIRNGEPVDTGIRLLLYLAPRWMFLNFPVFVGWTGFYLALDAARRLRAQERQLYSSIMLAQESKLKMLRFQLNPHFLFNTLNAISSLLLDNRSREADDMLTRLSGFLRFTLDAAPDDRVPLRREIEAQRLYLEIEKARFTDRLEVDINVEDGVSEALVPTMILQPLLENAVKYAVSQTTRPVHVAVQASRLASGRLELRVSDSGAGNVSVRPSAGAGVGLNNIRARLGVLYGDAADMRAGPRAEGGFEVVIRMPFEENGEARRGAPNMEGDNAGTTR
jgi:signal transduction histidine kinase